MKKSVIILVAFALLLTACGGTANSPATVATEAGVPATTQASVATETVVATTSRATDQPAENTDGKVQVQVTEGDNWIKADLTTFKVGVKYVFTITNTGRRAHSFSISHPTTDKTASGIDAVKAGALVFVSEDELFPGAVVMVEHTFSESAPPGTLEFACLILMHYKMGQVLPISVE